MREGDLFELEDRVFLAEKVFRVNGHPVSCLGVNLTPKDDNDKRYWGIALEDHPVQRITRH